MKQKVSLFGPLLLIAAGVIWLLVRAGTIPSENLWALTHIWPYLLIAAGLGLILRAYWAYATVLLDVLIVSGAVLAIVFAPQLGWAGPPMSFVVGDGDFFVGPGIPGSGNVITETRNVGDFTVIEVDFPAQVTVTQGEAVSVKVEAEDNVMPGLQTSVSGDTLEIFYRAEDGRRVNPRKLVKVTIVVKDLREVKLTSAGEVTITGIRTEKLTAVLSGAGNLKLEDIAVEEFTANLSGAGNLSASGMADKQSLVISGFGSFNAGNLHSQTATVTLSGAGSATLWVDDALSARISGAGSVNYYGAADVTEMISGVGSVNHLGNK
jgi:hypothetical protein